MKHPPPPQNKQKTSIIFPPQILYNNIDTEFKFVDVYSQKLYGNGIMNKFLSINFLVMHPVLPLLKTYACHYPCVFSIQFGLHVCIHYVLEFCTMLVGCTRITLVILCLPV